jgi:hypothetical protein
MARPTDYVAREARAADLVITGASREAVLLDPLRRLDPSDLLMQAGRPIFIVPPCLLCRSSQEEGEVGRASRGLHG